jgi:alkylation response protein AidB-like acyl-CoA dehydrogenase
VKNEPFWPGLEALRAVLAATSPAGDASTWLEALVHAGVDRLPLPGSGRTLERWQALAAVAEHDLSLAKLYEGHTDALAILAELVPGAPGFAQDATWGVWAAEAPPGGTTIERGAGDEVVVDGAKNWCSGAASASHALLTAWETGGAGPQLISLAIRQPGVSVLHEGWKAVGMAGSASLDLRFHKARGRAIGGIGAYLERPGFWQGGAGIAACWYGGSCAIASALHRSLASAASSARTAFKLTALGKVDVALQRTAAALREAASWIDAHPAADAGAVALRARLAAEHSATQVLDEVGRALGATPFCRDARFARAAADLPVFIRQSHADRDLAALGEKLLTVDGQAGSAAWKL